MASTTDVVQILRLMVDAVHLSPVEYIQKTLGSLRYIYYAYVKNFGIRPIDLEDMIDGLLYMDADGYIQKEQIREAKRG